ncbi:MAG: MarR family winged helix-turn-helix transcriptional regulator [Pseudomonadales bacterium]|jgi:DNA-binding MarR family transcriptional regulator|nr:MarR family winged helix-turn-helix transcriptional regulator [Pseudomonadales bacterium]
MSEVSPLEPSRRRRALAPLADRLRQARRELGADATLLRLSILLTVYMHEGRSQNELLGLMEATSATALSRNLADLSAWTSRKAPGPGLVELRADPMNLRRKTVHLTDQGRAVAERILDPPA